MDAPEIAADHIEGGHDLVRGLDTRRSPGALYPADRRARYARPLRRVECTWRPASVKTAHKIVAALDVIRRNLWGVHAKVVEDTRGRSVTTSTFS